MLFSSEINILNISVGGAAIETPRRLNLGGEYTLKLEDKGKTFSIKGRLGGIRFKIHAPERAVLSMPYSYKVKKISAGGMLIESYERLNVDDRFPMEIFIPVGSAHKAVGFLGRVASCIEIEDSYPKHYDVGIEFLDMPEDSKNNLMEFIKSLEEVS